MTIVMLSPANWLPPLLEADRRFRLAAQLFLRVLALIYLAAFLSTALEITGLVGLQGILPASDYLNGIHAHIGHLGWLRFPTLFWIDSSDTALMVVSYLGCTFSVLLFVGFRPLLSLIILYVLYLSLYKVGQMFFNFQWEYLLLEAGFLAIFLTAGASRLLIFLFHLLLFRLRFLSGVSKLSSGDPVWANLTALQHYFETQPLPHMGAWYAHHLPEWLLRTGTGFTLFVELIVPFFIFLPRSFRLFAAAATILIQLLIIATSNHNWINLLTIALCLFLLDDQALRRMLPRWLLRDSATTTTPPRRVVALSLVAVLIIPTSIYSAWEFLDNRPSLGWSHPVNWVRGWGLGNAFHVFPTMQTERHELTIQGSRDGIEWHDYAFRYKPNAAGDRPAFIVPLHPRLDWMIWFIPPRHPGMRPWFERFMQRLSENSPSVTALLARNPFPVERPRYLRILVHRYRFTTPDERARSNHIWVTEYLGQFPHVRPRSP